MNGLVHLSNLQTLILAFNEIKAIKGLSGCPNLTRLDLNHNFIQKIENLENQGRLKQLNLSNNWISENNDLTYLSSKCPDLEEFHLKCNPIAAQANYRIQVFTHFSDLVSLDQLPKSKQDVISDE